MSIHHDYCFVFRKLEDIALGQPAGRIELDSTCMVFPFVIIFNQFGVNIALCLHPPQTRLINMQFIKSVNQSTSEKSLSCVSIIIFLTNYEVTKAN